MALPDLPEDIWRHIASYLPLRAWARAAGTCKAFWQLWLGTARVASRFLDAKDRQKCTKGMSLPEAALLSFAAKRWSQSTVIKIHLREQSLAVVQGIMHQNPPRHARALLLAWHGDKETGANISAQSLLLSFLTRQAQCLEYLWLETNHLFCIPTLAASLPASLRHLNVSCTFKGGRLV